MSFERSSGILLHITSLPSYGGIGDLGPAAYQFADFLAAAKQRLWQVLPLSPTGYGSSPYAALSAFAGNPLLVSLEKLADWGWIEGKRIADLPGRSGNIHFDDVEKKKMPLLVEAARNFLQRHEELHLSAQWTRFDAYCRTNATWLNNYAHYNVLRRKFSLACWNEWRNEYAYHEPDAISLLEKESGEELAIEQVIQFAFEEQWMALRAYCAERDIRFIGDVAIFVSYDSADVWTQRDIFDLNEDLSPIRVSGVPPDYFSATGQRWGNPLYKWDVLEERGFDWWIDRIRRAHSLYDVIRLDHFRGFEAYWSIPAEDDTAVNGEWVKAPGAALFSRLREALGELPFIAEDLGLITPEVDALREQFNLPGMRILQFGFSNRGAHNYLPHRYEKNTVVYTGTHDNDTTRGWWENGATKVEKGAVKTYVHPGTREGVVWPLIRAASTSVADICLFPLQDILELGSEARMNVPSRSGDNWGWRCPEGMLTPELAKKLGDLTLVADRDRVQEEEKSEAAQK
ncbi:4-alpha-glucanotransferase [Alloacidobacterium dinghuense]|uniref:4-alpha-glucanotransferase n=1 Tax=Alloacidobacterium dinghuense TaxID=2763107 RepID=A0A7G8BP65_9BACT|nr:4-alpha-glucanotransferase [Alloacidobacterium dinghuense]QNI34335.1 4-alpha-glucanotransferase [Alloacidobacterium dinghuense]